jgi:cytochrome P450
LTTVAKSLLAEVDALYNCEAEALTNPYRTYARLRKEAPVLIYRDVAAVSHYVDAHAMLSNTTDYSNSRSLGSHVTALAASLSPEARAMLLECVRFHDRWLVRLDPPDHTRIRGLAHRVFTPRRISGMTETIQIITDQLLDEAQAKGPTVDLIDEVIYKVPLMVVGNMLGVPAADYERIHQWSKTVAVFISDFGNPVEMFATLKDFRSYLAVMIEERRREPHTDLLAALLAPDETGDRLSAEELQAIFILLLFAGHDTTTNLVGSGLAALLSRPDQLVLLRDEPELIGNAVEELLRFEAPNQTIHRYALRDTRVHDVLIPAGMSIKLMVGSANHDPARFPNPDEFDVRRSDTRHLSFGFGPHFCLGQALARLEARILISTFLERFPQASLAGELKWKPNLMFRGLEALPVALS